MRPAQKSERWCLGQCERRIFDGMRSARVIRPVICCLHSYGSYERVPFAQTLDRTGFVDYCIVASISTPEAAFAVDHQPGMCSLCFQLGPCWYISVLSTSVTGVQLMHGFNTWVHEIVLRCAPVAHRVPDCRTCHRTPNKKKSLTSKHCPRIQKSC